jgi:hypothetical protein
MLQVHIAELIKQAQDTQQQGLAMYRVGLRDEEYARGLMDQFSTTHLTAEDVEKELRQRFFPCDGKPAESHVNCTFGRCGVTPHE